MKLKCRFVFNLTIFLFVFVSVILFTTCEGNAFSKIINKVEILDVVGIKLIREEIESGRYKLAEIPSNVNVIDAKIASKGELYKFTKEDGFLIDSSGNFVDRLQEKQYTLVLNTKELGEVYKILNKTEYGYASLDIKVVYNKYKNSLELTNSNLALGDSEVTIFKSDKKIGGTTLNGEGKGSIYINDLENLATSTYTILVKRGSEIIGIDVLHINPIYKDLDIKNNVSFNIASKISNKLNVSIKEDSGITLNDKVQVASVYDEQNPNENLLMNLDVNNNNIFELNGEVILKSALKDDKNYKVRLKINGVELDSKDDCDVHIESSDFSKIKASVVEKVGKELRIDLSGVENLDKDTSIEVISLYDVRNKEKNLISPSKINNKVNDVLLLEKLESNNSYEILIKVNNFMISPIGVEIINLDLSNAQALTDIISNKVFISLENAKGLKITDSIKVVGVFKDKEGEQNFLKSNYNTLIEKLNGTVFINQPLDTKGNYYIKFKINDVELDNVLKVTVNNNISFKGAKIIGKVASQELEICFKNVDCINNNDLIEVYSVFDLTDVNFNFLDESKERKIFNKNGIVHLKASLLQERNYGAKVKVNGVLFHETIPISMDNENKVQNIKAYYNENNLVLDLSALNFSKGDTIEILNLKRSQDNLNIISDKILNLNVNDDGELVIPLNITLKNSGKYIMTIKVNRNGVEEKIILEFNNDLIVNKIDKESSNENNFIEESKVAIDYTKNHKVNFEALEFFELGFKFKHNLNPKMKFNKCVCYIPKIKTSIENGYIIVENLIPYKKYQNLKIKVENDNGAAIEITIPEFVCGESEDDLKNFLSKTYTILKSGLQQEEDKLFFADEAEFWFWENKIRKRECDLRKFVLDVMDEKEFLKTYADNSERIKILYKIIFGITPSEQSLKVWINDFNKISQSENEYKVFRTIAEKMFTNFNFKSLEKQLKNEKQNSKI